MKGRISIPFPLTEAEMNANVLLACLSQRGTEKEISRQNMPPRRISPRTYSWNEKECPDKGCSVIAFSLWGGCDGFYVKGLLESFDWSPNGTAWRAISMRVHFRGLNPARIGGWGSVKTPDIFGDDLQDILGFHFHRYGGDEEEARSRMNAALDRIIPVEYWVPVVSDHRPIKW